MGQITSSVGLISGIDTGAIIDQLMAIEGRTRDLVVNQVEILTAQKTSFLDVNARLSTLDLSATAFIDEDSFGQKLATSSTPAVLSASADNDAPIGSYQFTVDRLVSTHQLISKGYVDTDTTQVGLATTLVFEGIEGRLDNDVELSSLNGGDGVERGTIIITDRSGNSSEVDLSRAVTIDDVLQQINNAAAISVSAAISGDQIVLTDNSGGAGNLIVGNVGSKQTATSLGIAGSVAASTLTGTSINDLSTNTVLRALNDGLGVGVASGLDDFQIDDGTSTFSVNLDNASNVGDVLDAINNAAGNTTITASVSGAGLVLNSTAAAITVTAENSSTAAADLGIAGSSAGTTLTGSRVLAAVNSRLLKNLSTAATITAGTVDVNGTAIDLSSAQSVTDVIDLINAETGTTSVTAALNSAGNGITLTHASSASFDVSDTTGNLATQLNLAGTHATGTADSGDLDLQYINANSRLDSINGGKGVAGGKFTITDSNGAQDTVDLTQGETTLAEVIAEINSRPNIQVTASINSTGDGVLLTDSGGGALKLKVEEAGSTTAADLGLLGEDEDADGELDGSYERSVSVLATDTLQDVVDKINAADVPVSAAIINDGTESAPFRVSLTSSRTGAGGSILLDDGGLGLNASTLVEGRDAVVFFGSSDPAEALLITSSTNALSDTISGVTINLNGTSDEAVSLTVSQDTEQIVTAVSDFVDRFNDVISRIDELDSFNSDTEEKGLLLGDPTISTIKRQLISLMSREYTDVTGQYTRLNEVGITFTTGAQLSFDVSKFRDALANDLDAVTELFSLKEESAGTDEEIAPGIFVPASGSSLDRAGFGAQLELLLDGLTDSIDGLITTKTNTIDTQIEISNDRIEQLNELLDVKRQRLVAQYAAMETILSQLQAQSSALASLASAVPTAG